MLKKGFTIETWNGQHGTVVEVVGNKINVLFPDGQRFCTLDDIVSSKEPDDKFSKAKKRLSEFKSKSSKMQKQALSPNARGAYLNQLDKLTQALNGDHIDVDYITNGLEALKELYGEELFEGLFNDVRKMLMRYEHSPNKALGDEIKKEISFAIDKIYEKTSSLKYAPGKVDESKWDDAKQAIKKSTGKGIDSFGDSEWAQVNSTYQNMGGTFESKEGTVTAKIRPGVGSTVVWHGGGVTPEGTKGTVVHWSEIKTDGRGVPTEVDGAYHDAAYLKENGYVPVKLDSGKYDTWHTDRIAIRLSGSKAVTPLNKAMSIMTEGLKTEGVYTTELIQKVETLIKENAMKTAGATNLTPIIRKLVDDVKTQGGRFSNDVQTLLDNLFRLEDWGADATEEDLATRDAVEEVAQSALAVANPSGQVSTFEKGLADRGITSKSIQSIGSKKTAEAKNWVVYDKKTEKILAKGLTDEEASAKIRELEEEYERNTPVYKKTIMTLAKKQVTAEHLTTVQKDGYQTCKDCGGLVDTDFEWLGEREGVGETRHIERCEDCGRWRDSIVKGGSKHRTTAGHPNESFKAQYALGDIFVPSDGSDDTNQITIVGMTENSYVVEQRPIGDRKPDKDDRTYGVRFEMKFSEIEGNKELKKFANKTMTSDIDRVSSKLEKLSNEEPSNWTVVVYNDNDKEIESWVIKNRTENEAEKEALADVGNVKGFHDWSMTKTSSLKMADISDFKLKLDAANSDGSLLKLRLVGQPMIYMGVPEMVDGVAGTYVLYSNNESKVNGEAPVSPTFSLDDVEKVFDKLEDSDPIEPDATAAKKTAKRPNKSREQKLFEEWSPGDGMTRKPQHMSYIENIVPFDSNIPEKLNNPWRNYGALFDYIHAKTGMSSEELNGMFPHTAKLFFDESLNPGEDALEEVEKFKSLVLSLVDKEPKIDENWDFVIGNNKVFSKKTAGGVYPDFGNKKFDQLVVAPGRFVTTEDGKIVVQVPATSQYENALFSAVEADRFTHFLAALLSNQEYDLSTSAKDEKVISEEGMKAFDSKASKKTSSGDLPDNMVDAYLVTALWSSTVSNPEDETDDTPLDKNHDISDVAPESREKAQKDCDAFLAKAKTIITGMDPNFVIDESNMGFCFWLNRNGHGSGFWDDPLYPKEMGKALSDLSEEFGGCDALVGDDGKIYLEGGKDVAASKTTKAKIASSETDSGIDLGERVNVYDNNDKVVDSGELEEEYEGHAIVNGKEYKKAIYKFKLATKMSPSVKKYFNDAWEYFNNMKLVPDADDIFEYVFDALEADSGVAPNDAWLRSQLGSEKSSTKAKIASLTKKAERLGEYEFDVHGGENWTIEAGEDGKKKIVRRHV